jgi:radical SAM superfamily enzyme YgiQ (UPF0313 family)
MVRISHSSAWEEAIQLGALVDVSEMAKELWIEHPTAVTVALWKSVCDIPKGCGETVQDRQWDLLWRFKVSTIKEKGPFYHFKCSFNVNGKDIRLNLKALRRTDDDGKSAITIMLETEKEQ